MGPEEPQVPQAPQVPEQPQQPMPQPLPVQAPQMQPIQPVQQPIQPQQPQFGSGLQQPFGPQQFGPNPVGMPQMPKKSKKGLVIGLVAGGVVLLLAVVGVILALTVFGPPSKADYQKAYDKAKTMVTQYDDFNPTSDFADLTKSSEAKQKFGELKATYDKNNTELAGMKALNDADVKKAFSGYKQKYEAAMPVAQEMVTMSVACGNMASSLSNAADATTKQEALDLFDSAASDCLSALKEMSTSSDSDFASYGKSLYDYFNALRTYYGDAVAARAANDRVAYSKLKVPSAPTTSAPSLSSDKYKFASAFDTLTNLLRDKANK